MKTMNLALQAIMVAIVALMALPKAIGLTLLYYVESLPFSQFNEGGPADFKALQEATQKAIAALGAEFKADFDKALKEAKAAGDMSAESKEKVDQIFNKSAELQARLLEVEQKAARQQQQEERLRDPTAGQILVESDEFKKFVAAGGVKSMNSALVVQMPRAAITSLTTSGGTGVAPDRQPAVIPGTEQPLTVRDLIAPGTTGSNLVQYVRENVFTNNAATVSEGDTKPESSITYELKQATVVTIAHFIKASKQILDDFSALQSMVDQRLRYGVKLVEETQLLKGSGTGNNLNGIYTQATAYSPPIALGGSVTMIDTIRLMILQAALAMYPPTGIVLHPSDWAKIELTKDANRGYIFANPQTMAIPRLWGLPVVQSLSMTVDTALVGAFRMGAQLFDREEVNVVISSENDKDFVQNLITIRAEERVTLAVYRPTAFIKNTNLPAS